MLNEWEDELDYAYWVDEETNLPCKINRASHSGALCGYVGIPKVHKLYKVEYYNIEVEVHGGLTYGRLGTAKDAIEEYCWIGFDCAHSCDLLPKCDFTHCSEHTYRNWDYVKQQVTNLAKQVSVC